MKRFWRSSSNLAVGVSFVLFVAAIVANVIAVLRPISWCIHATPAKSEFIRLDGWHVLLCQQSMVVTSGTLPPTHQFNTSHLGAFGIAFPRSPSGKWGLHLEEYVSQYGYKPGFYSFNDVIGGVSIPGSEASTFIGQASCSLTKLGIPIWSLVILFSIWPMLTTIRWWRTRRRLWTGRCLACGYDLRATPDRCPECGAVPEAAKGAAA